MNTKIRLTKPKGDQLFSCIFIVWYIMTFIYQTNIIKINEKFWDGLNSIFDISILFLMVGIIIFFQKYTLNELIPIIVITIYMIAIVVITNNKIFISTWIFIVASKNVDFNFLFQKIYKIHFILTLIVILLFFLGFIEQNIVYRYSIPRFSLGFCHPNILGFVLLLLMILKFITVDKVKWIHYIVAVLVAIFSWIVPNSQATTISLLLLVILFVLYNSFCSKVSKLKKLFLNVCIFLPVLLNVLSIWGMVEYGKYQWLEVVNKLFSGRLSYGHGAYEYYGITLLGNDIGQASWLILDNSYMFVLIRYGVLVYIFLSTVYLALMVYMKKIDGRYVIILFLFSVYGCMENRVFWFHSNIFIILINLLLYRRTSLAGRIKR